MVNKNAKKDLTTLDNIKIHYEVCDLNSGSLALIFLHGMGGNLKSWNKEREYFHSRKISTIAIDLRGHGLSGNPSDPDKYKISDLVKDVVGVLDKEKFKNYVIVGHCLGGMVVIDLEINYPKISKGVVLVDSSYKTPFLEKPLDSHSSAIKILNVLAKYSPLYKIAADVNQDKYVGSGDIDIRRLTSDILHTSLKSYLFILEDALEFDSSKNIGNIKKPVLIIQGMKDMIVPPKTALLIKHRIKTSWIDFMENANHVLVLNNPGDLSEEIYNFLVKLNLQDA